MHWSVFYLNLRRWTSKSCAPSLLIQGTQATPESSALKITSPGWRPSRVWYLAEAPALSAVAGNPVPALMFLSGSSSPEKTLLASAEERDGIRHIRTATYHPESNGMAEREQSKHSRKEWRRWMEEVWRCAFHDFLLVTESPLGLQQECRRQKCF